MGKRYHSAYIDGQHRLYGYSDTDYARTNTIPVVAFVDLDRSEQLKLFMDINENQKAVSKTLRVLCSWQRRRSDFMRLSTVDLPKESRDRYILNMSVKVSSNSYLPSCSMSSSVSLVEDVSSDLHKKHGKNYSTLHTLRGILRPAFAMAKKNRWVYDNPFDFPLAKKSYGGSKTRDALTRADMRRFLDFVCTDKRFNKYFNGIYILFNTGLRISEFCGLTIDDIDFEEHVIHVKRQLIRIHDGDKMFYYIEEPKTNNGKRDIPMFGDVEKVMKAVIDNRPELSPEPVYWNEEHTEFASGFLWLDKNNKIEVAQHWQNHLRWARDKFNRIYKDELPPISPHVCRHTFCSNLASAGMSPKTLQMIMGHSSIEITLNIYTHLEGGDVKNEFLNLVKSKSYDFYSLDRKPTTVAPVDDSELVEPEYDLNEDADDDDE